MNMHNNVRLTPLSREEMPLAEAKAPFSGAYAARAYGVSAEIVARWSSAGKTEQNRPDVVDPDGLSPTSTPIHRGKPALNGFAYCGA
jgi:hypothetical protein